MSVSRAKNLEEEMAIIRSTMGKVSKGNTQLKKIIKEGNSTKESIREHFGRTIYDPIYRLNELFIMSLYFDGKLSGEANDYINKIYDIEEEAAKLL